MKFHTQTHTYRQSWFSRVRILLLPRSNNGSSITGLTSHAVPRERKRDDEKRGGEGKGADGEMEGAADWRKAVYKTGLAEEKGSQKEKGWSSYIQSSRVLSPYKLQHRNWISLPESKLPPARKTEDVRVIACLHLHVLCTNMSKCGYLCLSMR